MEAREMGSHPPGPAGPRAGEQLPYLALPSTLGKVVNPWLYRGRRNLVLVFAGNGEGQASELLRAFAARHGEYAEEETEVLGIMALSPDRISELALELGPPFPLLSDEGGAQHRRFGAVDERGEPGLAVYVADRYGEVQERWLPTAGDPLPDQEQVLSRLRFVEILCPE